MPREAADARDLITAQLHARAAGVESLHGGGVFRFECHRADGELLWQADAPNMIVDGGVQYLLNTLSTAPPAVVGTFMGLIGTPTNVVPTIVGGDTMGSHAGWIECGTAANLPETTTARGTVAWSAAAGRTKAMTTAQTFTMVAGANGIGWVSGAFLVFSTGAVNTKLSTAGTLYSAGAFAPTQPVSSGNVLSVTYQTQLT